jgi:hypothetical protein
MSRGDRNLALLNSRMICPPCPPILGGTKPIQVPQPWGIEGAAKMAIDFTIHRSILQRPKPFDKAGKIAGNCNKCDLINRSDSDTLER